MVQLRDRVWKRARLDGWSDRTVRRTGARRAARDRSRHGRLEGGTGAPRRRPRPGSSQRRGCDAAQARSRLGRGRSPGRNHPVRARATSEFRPMRYAWLLIAIFAARFCVIAVTYPQIDGDISWQRWRGFEILRSGSVPHALGAETFSAAGAPWLPHEWLFSIAAALGSGGLGWTIFSGAVALCAVGALVLAALVAERRGASPKAVALCTMVAGIALFESFGVRAQVVAWPLLVGFLMLLECEGPLAWAALIVASLWSNVHGSAALAPPLAALVAVGAWLDAGRFTPRVRRLFAIAVASLGAICLNPLGWKLPAYSLMLLRNQSIRANIIEWKITGLEDPSFAGGAFALLLAAAVIGI